jgi:hypothetical protein
MLRRRTTGGHNLLEAILAGIIFATVCVGLMGIWQMQFQAMLKSKETAVASFLAEKIMEECVAAGFDGVDEIYKTPGEVIQVRCRTKAGESNASYTITVVRDEPAALVNQKTVVVTVGFSDSTGPRTVEYHTYLNQNA